MRSSPLLRILLSALLALVALVALACAGGSGPAPGGRTVLLDDGDGSVPSAGGAAPARARRPVLATPADDARAGREASEEVAAQMGLLGDAELDAYVQRVGERLLRGVPRQGFRYRFSVVDQVEPNAFALPGGHVFVSRGLLALVNTEDELANVIGHEITHAARRHAAAQQAASRAQNPLSMPWARAATMAAYSREMERDADRGGQQLAAAAGYDPMGMSTFLARLGQMQRLETGPRGPSFFDSHPGSVERASVNAVRAKELRWRPDPALGDTRLALLEKVEGLPIGPRPEGGVFEGSLFLHPSLGFQIRFPDGWRLQNSNQAVGAMSPHRDAVVYLTADLPPSELQAAAETFIERELRGRATVRDTSRVKLGSLDALRVELEAPGGRGTTAVMSTFFAYRKSVWRITGLSPSISAGKHRGRMLTTTRSFRPIDRAQAARVVTTELHVVTARAGETFASLGKRSGNRWSPVRTAVANGFPNGHVFAGGEKVKIARLGS